MPKPCAKRPRPGKSSSTADQGSALSGAILRRREGRQRERVQARGKFVAEGLVDQALARNPALALELGRNDLDPEMRFAAVAVAGMTAMTRGFILDAESRRHESCP